MIESQNKRLNEIKSEEFIDLESWKNKKSRILCKHCKRSAENGIRCMGFCVSESGY